MKKNPDPPPLWNAHPNIPATPLINKDYSSREEGCIAKMLKELNLTTLEERRKQQRLIFFYKVEEGQIPAMPASDFITRNEGKRQIRSKKLDNCTSTNIVARQSRINSKSVKVQEAKSEQYKNFLCENGYRLEQPRR